jgi:Flp pilus assembly protein TadD
MFEGGTLVFDYEADFSLTADEAFRAGRGNCVSFTNLFIALGRSRGIPVRLAILEREPRAEREGDLVLVNTHVVAAYAHSGKLTVYDFYRLRRDEVRGVRLLDDIWVTAIYLNNLAVRHLRAGELEKANLRLDQALRLAPTFVGALGNLGVVRRRLGDNDGAFDAYRRALEIAPRDATVLGNLATLYTGLGRTRESAAALRTADLRSASPWALLVRGDLEAADGNTDAALSWYRKARRMAPDLAEVWAAIAQAEAAKGRSKAALKAATRALQLEPGNEAAARVKSTIAARPGS